MTQPSRKEATDESPSRNCRGGAGRHADDSRERFRIPDLVRVRAPVEYRLDADDGLAVRDRLLRHAELARGVWRLDRRVLDRPGWLPTGYYDLWGHWDNYNGAIAGRVFYLQNKPCWNGTWRTELFVHSEETAGQGQYCPTAGDDPYCWEGAYDYYSNGCIKVSRAGYPSDLRLVHDGWHSKSSDYRHGYFTINNWLYVRDG